MEVKEYIELEYTPSIDHNIIVGNADVITTTFDRPGNLVGVSDEINKLRPIEYTLNLIKQIRDDQKRKNILIVEAATGSGKSFVLPIRLFATFGQPNMLVAELTIAVTIELATNVAKFNPNIVKLGTNIGYLTGNRKVGKNGLMYATNGILVQVLRSILQNPNMIDVPKFILIDEAHKHTIELAIAFVIIKQIINILGKRSPFFIFMSGTIDSMSLSKYLDITLEGHYVHVTGYTSQRVDTYLDNDTDQLARTVTLKLKEIHEGKYDKLLGGSKEYKKYPQQSDVRKIAYSSHPSNIKPDDILIFAPTNGWVKRYYDILDKWCKEENLPMIIIKYTSQLYAEQTDEIMWLTRDLKHYTINGVPITRRITIATNAIETGISITGLKHLIDLGFVNSVEYNPHLGATLALIKPISQDSVRQRFGRVGRQIPGIAYGMYSKSTFDLLDAYSAPEMHKSDISVSYLVLKEAKIDYKELIDTPFTEMVHHVEDKLYALGFINNKNEVTELGKLAAGFTKIQVEDVKMILSGYAYDVCVADLITIAAVTSVANSNTIIPLCDQFISSLLHFEIALFGNDIVENESGLDIQFLQSIGVTSTLTDVEISQILSTRWDIVTNISRLGLSIYNVPSKLNVICDFLKEYALGYSKLVDHEAYNIICNFKRCIYEGYKLNTIYNTGCNQRYVTLKGFTIQIPPMYNKQHTDIYSRMGISRCDMPKVLIGHKFDIYEGLMRADIVSSLDGFIGVDPDLFSEYTCDSPDVNIDIDLYNSLLIKGMLIYQKINYKSELQLMGGDDSDIDID